jgi:hypothetical protein
MLETIGEFIVLIVAQYPGAFVRWIIFRRKRFKEYVEDDLYVNSMPLIVIVILGLIVIKLFSD